MRKAISEAASLLGKIGAEVTNGRLSAAERRRNASLAGKAAQAKITTMERSRRAKLAWKRRREKNQ